jgi:WD40 repeat protein
VNIKHPKELKGAIALSPDFTQYAERFKAGNRISEYYGVKIKEVTSGKEVKTLDWDKDWGKPYDSSFSPDGKKLAILCGGKDREKTAKVFDLTSGDMKLNLRHSLLEFVAFTPNSKRLASAGGPGAASPKETLWIWDIETLKKIVIASPTTPTCLAFSPDEKLVVAAHGKYVIKTPLLTTWDVATGKRVTTINRDEKEVAVAVAFSPDSKLIAAGTRDGIIKVFDAGKGKEVGRYDDIQDAIFAVAFHPKEKLLAATGKDKTIRFWDLGTKKLVSTTKLPKLIYYGRLRFSSDGTQFATYTTTGDAIFLWNVEVKK